MIDINELRQLAQAATPGPWFSDRRGNIWRRPLSDLYENGGGVAGDKPLAFVAAGWAGEGVTGYPFEANARLIAAANPAAVSELLDRLEAAEKERDAAELMSLALRDKLAEMERQEPVAWYSKQYGFVYMSRQPNQFEHGSILYLRNGAPAWRIEGSSKVALLDIASLPHGTVFYALRRQGEEK